MAAKIRRTQGAPSKGGLTTRLPSKPSCPRHGVVLNFDPSSMVWRCVEVNCQMIALPKEDVEAGKGKPTVGKGELELVRMVNGKNVETKYYLRAAENNVMVDITKYIIRFDVEASNRSEIAARVGLVFAKITEIHQE